MRKFVVVAVLTGTLALISGCEGSWDGAVKGTRTLYREYLNPPATIDYDDKGSLSDAESALAQRMYGVDTRLTALERFMENADHQPSSESAAELFARFPWLNGFTAVSASGEVLGQSPGEPLKQLDYAPLLTASARGGSLRGVRGLVEDTPLGPEVLMGVPVYRDDELMGLVIVHFDMRSLAPFSESPDDLVILSPQAVLWPGRFTVETTPLHGVDWEKRALSSSRGRVSGADGEFLWVARFIGTTPIIFATPVRGAVAENAAPVGRSLHVTTPTFLAPTREEDASSVTSSILDAPAGPEAEPVVQEKSISD